MTPEIFDSLATDQRYNFLYRLEPDRFAGDWQHHLPTPGQISHCHFANMPLPYQRAIMAYEANIERRLEELVEKISEMCERNRQAHFSSLPPDTFRINIGKRFAGIYRQSGGGSESIHCFVELETGNIYKPASYKKPALNHVRGNIWSPDHGMSCIGPYGVAYVEKVSRKTGKVTFHKPLGQI